MTLIEALLGVILTGVVTSAIAGALLVTIGPDGQSADRLAASHDTQLASLYLPTDLQSAGNAAGDVVIDGSVSISCASLPTHRTVLWLHQDATDFEVAYVVLDATPTELMRYECLPSGGFSTLTVAHHLDDDPSAASAVLNADGSYSLLLVIRVDDASPVSVEISGQSRVREGDLAIPTVVSTTTTNPLGTTTTLGGTTTTVGGTTTTVGGSTTTTAPPCTALTATANPDEPTRKSNGKLNDQVIVTVTLSSACVGLTPPRIQYRPQPTTLITSNNASANGSTWRATIPSAGNVDWNLGFVDITVIDKNGAVIGTFHDVFEVVAE